MFPWPNVSAALEPTVRPRAPSGVLRACGVFDSGWFRLVAFIGVTPALVRALPQDQFGALLLAGAAAQAIGWPIYGIAAETSRRMTATFTVGNLGRARQIAIHGALVGSIMAFVAALLLLAGGFAVTDASPGSASPNHWAVLLTKATALRLFLEILTCTAAAALDGLAQVSTRRALRGLAAVLEVGAVFIAVAADASAADLARTGAQVAVIVLILHWIVLMPLFASRVEQRFHFELPLAADLLQGMAQPLAPMAILATLMAIDVVAAGLFCGLNTALVLAIAFASARRLSEFAQPSVDLLVPTFSDLALRQNQVQARWTWRRTMDAIVLSSTALALPILVFGKAIAERWLSLKWPIGVGSAVALLILGAAPVAVAWRCAARGEMRALPVRASALHIAVHLILLCALLPWLGVAGVAWAAALAQLSSASWLLPLRICRHLEIDGKKFVLSRTWRIALPIAPAVITALVFAQVKQMRNVHDLLVQLGVTLILHAVFGFAAWFLLETRPEYDID